MRPSTASVRTFISSTLFSSGPMKSFTFIHCPKVITCCRGAAHAAVAVSNSSMSTGLRACCMRGIVIKGRNDLILADGLTSVRAGVHGCEVLCSLKRCEIRRNEIISSVTTFVIGAPRDEMQPMTLGSQLIFGMVNPHGLFTELARRPPCILVVDDKLDTLLLVRELLTSRNYQVVTASDAEEALSAIREFKPDLILLDVIMPGRSGYDLCRELKEDPVTRLIPIVMITGLSDRSDRIRGIEAGADDFLSKPLYPEELYARVKSLLKLKEFTDELENAEAVLFTLALGVEARDPFTGGHCSRLAHYAGELGRHLRFDYDSIVALERGGYLHDLGKIKVPDEILKKETELTQDEWEIMKQHPVTGEAICQPLKSFRK